MTTKQKKTRGISRRQFMEWTGVGVGGVALSTMLPFSLRTISRAEAADITSYVGGSWTQSCCNMCGGQCGVNVYVEDGLIRKIEPQGGQPGAILNPNAVSNVAANYLANRYDATTNPTGDLGRLCCKGNSAIRSIYDPERLTTPMRRVGNRGTDEFEPITWDEAIEETARRLFAIRQTYGARSLVWFGEDHSFTHIQQDFCDAFGTPNYSNHANICDTSRKSAFRSTVGDDRPLADIENTDLLLVFGWNFLSAIKWIHLASIFARARTTNPNFHFIYVDPVFNTTASKANRWVGIRPGTDGALALAISKLLIQAEATTPGVLDLTFINSTTLGYDEFRRFLNGEAGTPAGMDYSSAQWMAAPYSGNIVTWASAVTGVPVADINAIAAKIVEYRTAVGGPRKICIDSWSGPGHHTNATQSGRAIGCLNLLLGTVDTPGSMLSPLRNGPSRRAASTSWPAKDGWRVDGRDDATIPASYTYPSGASVANPASGAIKKKYAYSHGSGIYVESVQRIIEQRDFVGNPYPQKACFIVFQNLMMSTPNVEKNRAALESLDFIVCLDTHMSETARMADIVIPGAQYLERNDLNANWVTFRSVGYRQAIGRSWIGGMTEWQFFIELGAAMGFDGFKTAPGNMTDEAMQRDEWATFRTGYTNQMTFDQLKVAGTWIETSDAAGTTIAPSTSGAASTPKSGTHYKKHEATKVYAPGTGNNQHRETPYVVGSQTISIVEQYSTTTSKWSAVGIGTGTLAVGNTFRVGLGTDSRHAQFWDKRLAGYFAGTTTRGDIVAGVGGNQTMTGNNKFHPLPWFSLPDDGPAWLLSGGTPLTGQYPLFFISWKEVEHTHTRTFNNPWLMEMRGENRLLIHPDTATPKSISEGDQVWVQTAYGVIRARAHVTRGIHAECVGFVRGFGHWASGTIARGKGAHDGWILPGKAELHSGQGVMKEVACRISKEV